ncbi:MAG: DegV family protein [Clostridia bacterium]|nr:DegV family protein [Clostridia bacterium]
MKSFAIVADSSCNLTSEQAKTYGIDAIVPMHFYLNETEYEASGDWKSIGAKEYYDAIRSGARVRSSQVTSQCYEETFRGFLNDGRDVLSLSCTGALSASVKESIVARERLLKEFPNAAVKCIDSQNCMYSLAMMLIEAAKMRDAGKTIDEVEAWITSERQNFNEVGTVDKLTYLRNAGRVSASAAFFGGVFSVKPIVVYDEEGHNVAIEKVRGRQGSLDRVAEYVKKYANVDKNRNICIAHADCEADAKALGEKIKAMYPDKDLLFHYGFVEPGVGSAVGPGTLILGFYGDPAIRHLNK